MAIGLNDKIRDYVNRTYVEPARSRKLAVVSLIAGDIHRELDLENRMPAVCSAIDAKKFAERYRVQLSLRSGPKQSSTVTWQFGVLP